MKNVILTIFLTLVTLTTCARGAELLVPSQYPTIQSAIYAAVDGDTVIVAPGTYTGEGNRDIDFKGKAITVRSINPNDPNIVASTIIDCKGTKSEFHRGFYFHNGEDSNSILTGLSITNGYMGPVLYAEVSGAIECEGSSPIISNCRIINNTTVYDGGGISCFNSNATITKCTITGNSASHGGGISCYQSNLIIRNCTITNNSANPYGGGIYCDNSSLTLINCTFSANSADDDGGGIYNHSGRPTITNCIFWNNIAPDGPEIYLSYDSNALVSYTDVKGGQATVYVEPDCTLNWGEGNIDTYPYFAFNTDYHIMPPSLCIDAGDPNYVPEPNETDLDSIPRIIGSRIDMGAYEYNPNTPSIAISASNFIFSCVQDREKPKPDTLLIRNRGGGILNWRIIEDCNWLQFTPTSGISTGEINEITITVDPNGLASGIYNYAFAIQDPNAINSPVKIQVALHIGALLRVPQQFLTIQAAIDAAENQDMVLVDDGIYTGTGNRDIDFRGKAITVRSENGPDNCIIDCQYTARGFYFHTGEDANSVVAGFNIRNGYAISGGGGISCDGGRAGRVSPSIIDCIITSNSTEKNHGIYCLKSSPTIANCTISGNLNGVKLFWESNANITNCTISNNDSSGIYCDNSSSTITDSTISNNNGSGIYCSNIYPAITGCTIITDCKITGNSANRGGGINCSGGQTTIADCIISDNKSSGRSGDGGGISVLEGLCLIYNSIISGNTATGNGGGLSNSGKTIITNCTFTGNSAPRTDEYGNFGNGGAISSRVETTITNCILYDNWAQYGNEIALLSPSKVDVNYSDVEGGQAAVYTQSYGTLIWGPGNIDADPCFAESGYWVDANDPNIIVEPNDPNAVWLDGDYHLLPASSCINAGDPNYVPEPNETDLDGLPRIIGGRIDMGAYEFNHQPVAIAGPNQTVYAWLDGFADVALDGSASYDDDNDLLDYYWSWTIGGVTCEANGVNPTIKLPVGIHIIELIVDDGIDLSEPDYCIITVVKAVQGRLTLSPNVLQIKSRGKWIIASLFIPPVLGEKINTTVPLRLYPSGIEAKYQHFSKNRRFGCAPTIAIAFFDKQQVIDALGPGRFEVSVVGEFLSGRFFFGSDYIKITTPKPPPNPWHW